MSLITKMFGDPHRREIGRHRKLVERINELEEEMRALSEFQVRAKPDEFRERIGYDGADISFGQSYAEGLLSADADDADNVERDIARREEEQRRGERAAALDEILPEAFAVVRETSRRVLGMRHFDVQSIGG